MIDKNFIDKARRLQKEVYEDYGPYIYVPMAESSNLALPVTLGCSYKKCLYCDLNHELDFKILSLEDIEKNLEKLAFINKYNRRPINKIVFVGGNPFVLDTDYLVEISKLVTSYFPKIEYISSFARADDILNKTKEELELLKTFKYDKLSIGIESGSDLVLNFQEKGASQEDNFQAMKKLEALDINYSSYIMLGLGGKEHTDLHAEETAKLLNKVNPFELTIVTMVLFKDAPLVEKLRDGKFKRLSPLESLIEEYNLLKNLDMKNTLFNATHKTNMVPIKGHLPQHKDIMLQKIKKDIERLKDKDLSKREHNRWYEITRE